MNKRTNNILFDHLEISAGKNEVSKEIILQKRVVNGTITNEGEFPWVGAFGIGQEIKNVSKILRPIMSMCTCVLIDRYFKIINNN